MEHYLRVGQRCGSVCRVVAFDTRGPRFESSHRQKNYIEYLFTVNCIENTKIKRGREWPIFWKKTLFKSRFTGSRWIWNNPNLFDNFEQLHAFISFCLRAPWTSIYKGKKYFQKKSIRKIDLQITAETGPTITAETAPATIPETDPNQRTTFQTTAPRLKAEVQSRGTRSVASVYLK